MYNLYKTSSFIFIFIAHDRLSKNEYIIITLIMFSMTSLCKFSNIFLMKLKHKQTKNKTKQKKDVTITFRTKVQFVERKEIDCSFNKLVP